MVRVTVFRSGTLMGDYEACPYNPVMRQTDPDAAIQRCGHGDLVETPDGRWYMVYLCGRMIDGRYSILGRETALDPVTWTADGWPVVNGHKGPSVLNRKPYTVLRTKQPERKAALSACGLPMEYMTPRTFAVRDIRCDVNEDGKLDFEINPSEHPLSSVKCRSIVLRRQTDFDFTVSVSVDIPADMSEGEEFGLTGYYDENTYCTYGIKYLDGAARLCVQEHIGDTDTVFMSDPIDAGTRKIRISMKTDGLIRQMYAGDDLIYTLDNVYYLCDEGLQRGKRFTGAMTGIYAVRPGMTQDAVMRRFEDIAYQADSQILL